MKKLIVLSLVLASCSAVSPAQIIKGVLNASQVLCVLATGLTNASEVATVCKIDSTLVPAIESVMTEAKAKGVGKLPARLDAGK